MKCVVQTLRHNVEYRGSTLRLPNLTLQCMKGGEEGTPERLGFQLFEVVRADECS